MFIELSIEGIRNPVHINTDQISSVNERVVKMTNCDILVVEEESMETLMAVVSPKKRTKDTQPKDGMLELFEQLHKLTGGNGKPIFTFQREKKLNDLLTKHRMTKENLINAATNIGKDDFLQGRDPENNTSNKRYGDIDYLLRPDKAAKYAEEQGKKKNRMF